MWFDAQRPDMLAHIRHNAQERDGMPAHCVYVHIIWEE